MIRVWQGVAVLCMAGCASVPAPPTPAIVSPAAGSVVTLGGDREKAVGVTVSVTDFTLRAAGQCGGNPRCGHLHLKIDPEMDHCNIPGRAYNSMNSDTGGNVVQARFGYCTTPTGSHVIGILLANDNHSPVLVGGKPVTATVTVTARQER
jgi:hypothetical protein